MANNNGNGWVHDPEAGIDVNMGRPRTADNGVYDWADDEPRAARPVPPQPSRPDTASSGRGGRAASAAGGFVGGVAGGLGSTFIPPITVQTGGGGRGGNGNGRRGTSANGNDNNDRHQGDRLIYNIEKIEFSDEKDVLALAKAINHLGRELHLILGMRAEELQGVLSTYKGEWYLFGAGSKVRARLVAAHLKVSAEAAKALGVGALKMAHAFDRHFVKPEQEAKQRAQGKKPARKSFTIGD